MKKYTTIIFGAIILVGISGFFGFKLSEYRYSRMPEMAHFGNIEELEQTEKGAMYDRTIVSFLMRALLLEASVYITDEKRSNVVNNDVREFIAHVDDLIRNDIRPKHKKLLNDNPTINPKNY